MHKNKLLYLILTLIFITSLHAQNKSDSISVKSDEENDKPIKTNSTEKHSLSQSRNENTEILLESPDTLKSIPTNTGKVENQYKAPKESPLLENSDSILDEEENSNYKNEIGCVEKMSIGEHYDGETVVQKDLLFTNKELIK